MCFFGLDISLNFNFKLCNLRRGFGVQSQHDAADASKVFGAAPSVSMNFDPRPVVASGSGLTCIWRENKVGTFRLDIGQSGRTQAAMSAVSDSQKLVAESPQRSCGLISKPPMMDFHLSGW